MKKFFNLFVFCFMFAAIFGYSSSRTSNTPKPSGTPVPVTIYDGYNGYDYGYLKNENDYGYTWEHVQATLVPYDESSYYIFNPITNEYEKDMMMNRRWE